MTLTAIRTGQDEVQITCSHCDFLHTIPLTIDGRYDGTGRTINRGVCNNHGRHVDRILAQAPPVGRPGDKKYNK